MTGHDASHTVRRVAEVIIDTAKINVAAESIDFIGFSISGQMANAAVEKYTKKMVIDYKIVDSIKQKCIERNLKRRFGSKLLKGQTKHWPGPNPSS